MPVQEPHATRRPSRVLLIGSGETAQVGRRMHERMLEGFSAPIRMAILETPAGFELNSEAVARRINDFFIRSLQNLHPNISIIPARRKDGPLSTNNRELASPIDSADYLFLGPGSPTYLVRHLANSLVLKMLTDRLCEGAILCLASAAAIAFGAFTLPVYEIFKAGADIHWIDGLDFFGVFGLKLAVITHWNNNEGGDTVDTSRCFVGKPRMTRLLDMLPEDAVVVGIDEYTGLGLDLLGNHCEVMGLGNVTLIRLGSSGVKSVTTFESGSSFSIEQLGPFHLPAEWASANNVNSTHEDREPIVIPEEVRKLLKERNIARKTMDFKKSDELRGRVGQLGFNIQDTATGQDLYPK